MTNKPKTNDKSQPPLKFPAKLYRILNTAEFNDIICWLPHGRSWRVLQQERFEKEVLPAFFRHGRYASFIRQVNGWGFRRIQSGPDFNSYYHESFVRDSPESCRRMRRPTAEEIADRKKEDPDSHPNFYLLSSAPKAPQIKKEQTHNVAFPSASKATLGDFKNNLIRRLLASSVDEKAMILNLELQKLEAERASVSNQLLALQLLNRSASNSASPMTFQPKPCDVPSFALQPSMDALTRLSFVGQMQLRSQLLACGAGGEN